MSLLDSAYEPYALLEQESAKDSRGTITRIWKEGAEIIAAAVYDTSLQARIAGVQGVTSLYTVTTPRSVTLRFHDVIRRKSDGLVLRVTSRGRDKATPESATLDMRQVSAEEYVLSGEIVQPPEEGEEPPGDGS